MSIPNHHRQSNHIEYGHPFTKKTLLWERGVPLLMPTNIVMPERTWCPSGAYSNKHGEKHRGMFTRIEQRTEQRAFPGVGKSHAGAMGRRPYGGFTMREIAVHEFKKVPRNCSTCLYGGGIGCGNANVGKEYLAYLYGLRECPHYWLDQNRFEPVDGRRWYEDLHGKIYIL